MAESENLYQQIKNHFLSKDRPQIVIEISDLPIDQWKVTSVGNADEMVSARCKLVGKDQDFAGFIYYDNEYFFYFLDHNLYKSEDFDTGRIDDYQDRTFSEFDLNKVAAELRQLLHGS